MRTEANLNYKQSQSKASVKFPLSPTTALPIAEDKLLAFW